MNTPKGYKVKASAPEDSFDCYLCDYARPCDKIHRNQNRTYTDLCEEFTGRTAGNHLKLTTKQRFINALKYLKLWQ